MEKIKEIEYRRIQQYFKPFVKDTLENIDFNYDPVLNKSEINIYKIKELRKIYNSSLPFEKSWLRRAYPKVKSWQIKWFPRAWMNAENNPKIAQAIERCPSFLPIINYLFDYNRYWHGIYKEERKKMIALADKITGEKRYKGSGGKYVFATFITGQAFYREISKATGCSKNTIQRYLKALAKIGCLKELDKGKGGKGVLYADGYYVPYKDTIRKISFLKNSTEIRKGLIRLPKLIKEYQISIKRLKLHA